LVKKKQDLIYLSKLLGHQGTGHKKYFFVSGVVKTTPDAFAHATRHQAHGQTRFLTARVVKNTL
jgi:hypothetical protein